MSRVLISIILFYQKINQALIALHFPLLSFSGCRQWPTCSMYSIQSIERFGVIRGLAMGARRVLQCHPFS